MNYEKKIFEDADDLLLEAYVYKYAGNTLERIILESEGHVPEQVMREANLEKQQATNKINQFKKKKDHKGIIKTMKDSYVKILKKGGPGRIALIGVTAVGIAGLTFVAAKLGSDIVDNITGGPSAGGSIGGSKLGHAKDLDFRLQQNNIKHDLDNIGAQKYAENQKNMFLEDMKRAVSDCKHILQGDTLMDRDINPKTGDYSEKWVKIGDKGADGGDYEGRAIKMLDKFEQTLTKKYGTGDSRVTHYHPEVIGGKYRVTRDGVSTTISELHKN